MKLQLEIQLNLVRELVPASQEMKDSWNYYYLVLGILTSGDVNILGSKNGDILLAPSMWR